MRGRDDPGYIPKGTQCCYNYACWRRDGCPKVNIEDSIMKVKFQVSKACGEEDLEFVEEATLLNLVERNVYFKEDH